MGATHTRRTSRPIVAILTVLALMSGVLAVVAPVAGGMVNTCRARNVTKDTPAESNLQRVIWAASFGDTIAVKFVCVGNFTIGKRLTLVGKPTPEVPRPVLHANGSGRPLLVRSGVKVTLTNLMITGGDLAHNGGGIYNTGILTLKDTVVRGNTARGNTADYHGGGIVNLRDSTLTLMGSSSVSGNTASYSGGIYNRRGTLTLNGSSSVRGNTSADSAAGIENGGGTLTLNGSSSVSGNVASERGGEIYTYTGTVTLKNSSSVVVNTAGVTGGGIEKHGTVSACDSSGVDEWIGTVEPNDPNDFLDSDVTLITCT